MRSVSSRLDRLQKYIIDGDESCTVKVIFKDGSTFYVPFCDFTGGFDENGELVESEIELAGWRGEIEAISCDNWKFSGVVELAAGLWGARYVC